VDGPAGSAATKGKESDMADKWADYLISAVRYDAAGTHIDKVRVHEDEGEKVGPPG
jgi:hypothetical protein